ncbi:hypothetical protein FRB99_004877 [Tulasnella sp. 403]|nr:hypothetical protein FRB99_004877 [Tulasnella sp. 403]
MVATTRAASKRSGLAVEGSNSQPTIGSPAGANTNISPDGQSPKIKKRRASAAFREPKGSTGEDADDEEALSVSRPTKRRKMKKRPTAGPHRTSLNDGSLRSEVAAAPIKRKVYKETSDAEDSEPTVSFAQHMQMEPQSYTSRKRKRSRVAQNVDGDTDSSPEDLAPRSAPTPAKTLRSLPPHPLRETPTMPEMAAPPAIVNAESLAEPMSDAPSQDGDQEDKSRAPASEDENFSAKGIHHGAPRGALSHEPTELETLRSWQVPRNVGPMRLMGSGSSVIEDPDCPPAPLMRDLDQFSQSQVFSSQAASSQAGTQFDDSSVSLAPSPKSPLLRIPERPSSRFAGFSRIPFAPERVVPTTKKTALPGVIMFDDNATLPGPSGIGPRSEYLSDRSPPSCPRLQIEPTFDPLDEDQNNEISRADAELYVLEDGDRGWVKKGGGILRLIEHTTTRKFRLVLHDGPNILVNVAVDDTLRIEPMYQTDCWQFIAPDCGATPDEQPPPMAKFYVRTPRNAGGYIFDAVQQCLAGSQPPDDVVEDSQTVREGVD